MFRENVASNQEIFMGFDNGVIIKATLTSASLHASLGTSISISFCSVHVPQFNGRKALNISPAAMIPYDYSQESSLLVAFDQLDGGSIFVIPKVTIVVSSGLYLTQS
jgi:hypothetical protein